MDVQFMLLAKVKAIYVSESNMKIQMNLFLTPAISFRIIFLYFWFFTPDVEDTIVRLKPIENIIPAIVNNVFASASGMAKDGNIHESNMDIASTISRITFGFIVVFPLRIAPFPETADSR